MSAASGCAALYASEDLQRAGRCVRRNAWTLGGAEIALLESAVLDGVSAGAYFLSSAPLKMQGLDGSPCRPLLIDFEEGGQA